MTKAEQTPISGLAPQGPYTQATMIVGWANPMLRVLFSRLGKPHTVRLAVDAATASSCPGRGPQRV